MNKLDINALDAVGVYTIEIDASTPPIQIDSQRTRVIVGFSPKGPKNTMVYLRTKADAINVFGNIDPYLERRGCFFQRGLQTALETGPVFALNLLRVNNDPISGDKVEFASYSLSTASKNAIADEQGNKLKYMYQSFFNQERFWKADDEYFQSIVNNVTLSQNKLFSVVNLGNSPVTILTKKAAVVPRDFQLTVSEFFGSGQEPTITNPFDFVSDYFVDVIVIEGKWDDYQKLSADPIFGSFFDNKGLRKDRLDAFLGSDAVNVVAQYTGSVLPELLDGQNNNFSIDTLINRDFVQTGIFCALNNQAIEDYDGEFSPEGIDLVGHNLVNQNVNKVDYLSYSEVIDSLEIVTEDGQRFDFTQLGVDNVTANDLGFNIVSAFESVQGVFTNLNYEELSVDLDLTDVEYDNLYVNLGQNNWIYGQRTNGTVSGVATKNHDNNLLFDKNIVETLFSFVQEGGNYTCQFSKEDAIAANPELETKDWFINLSDGTTGLTFYKFDNTINPTLEPITATMTVVEVPVSDTIEYKITITSGNLTDSEYNLAINPFVAGEVNIYATRKESSIVENDPNLFVIGKYNVDFDDVNNITSQLIWDNTINKNKTAEDFIINDTGAAYKLVKRVLPDGTVVLDDRFADDNQGAAFEFINGQMKLDLVDGNTIWEKYTMIRPTQSPDTIIVGKAVADNIQVGNYIVGDLNGQKVLTRVVDKIRDFNLDTEEEEFEISTILPIVIEDGQFTKFNSVEEFITHFNVNSLNGFTFTSYHLPNGTDEQMNNIYNVLDPANTNLREILSDRNIVDWRYLVDTFSGGIAPNMGGKAQLSILAMTKKQGLALLNSPSMKEFAESTNPLFTNAPTTLNPKPILNSDFIRTGGNLDLGPRNRFTIPNEEHGGKYAGVFGPYLAITENAKRKVIPPAADVSNNYMRKFRIGQPYGIVAGEPLGVISNPNLIGTEYDLLNRDRANFEKIGINPIVFRDGVVKIFANLTGYQRVVSPLNSLHVRDLLISIENTLINITSKYLFRKNTPAVRLEIQTIVETYLEGVLTDGGLTNFNVRIDESNNTPEIIDQRIALLDVEVQPALGMEKFVNRITIYGASTSAEGTGFERKLDVVGYFY